jgi:DNA polymerase-1
MPDLSRFLMEEVELLLIEVVADLENVGYLVDAEFFRNLRATLEPRIAQIDQQLRDVAGFDFNPNSPDQKATLLFDRLGLTPTKVTDGGKRSTDKAVLKKLDHPVASLLLERNRPAKIVAAYCSIPEKVDDDGRLRVEFNQLGAVTGRFTSGSVIQTIPKENDAFCLRKGFIASSDKWIVAADFDQQELRILAGVSGDRNMLQAIADGRDLHGLAAVRVFSLDCEPNEVADKFPAKRKRVKSVQFGIIYGRSARSLADELEISADDAEKLQRDYFTQFPGVKAFVAEAHARVVRDGCVSYFFGRQRYLPDATLRRPRNRYDHMSETEKETVRKINRARRQAQNFLIQGAAATITKLAMLRCHKHIKAEHPNIRMILQVHDELHFEVPDEQVVHFIHELPGLTCDLGLERFGFNVPMAVQAQVGPSWGELTKIEDSNGTDAAE